MVLKCRHKESGQLVAIKKFLESEEDSQVKKIAMREIRLLKQLRHDNLVNLVEVFRRRKRLYLVFEYVEHNLLDELDACPKGMNAALVRKYMWQLLQALDFCHSRNIVHRDIKPENILISAHSVLKLCDFGFARSLTGGEPLTDYVATRWYRSPELLIGDPAYSKPVDIWAAGCLFVEMLTGDPLFAGDSDIDQLHQIVRCFGTLCQHHISIMLKNPLFASFRFPDPKKVVPMESRLKTAPSRAVDFAKATLDVDPATRFGCKQLMEHSYFTCDNFPETYAVELQAAIDLDMDANPLLARKRAAKTTKSDLKDAIKMVSGSLLTANVADSIIRRSAPPSPAPGVLHSRERDLVDSHHPHPPPAPAPAAASAFAHAPSHVHSSAPAPAPAPTAGAPTAASSGPLFTPTSSPLLSRSPAVEQDLVVTRSSVMSDATVALGAPAANRAPAPRSPHVPHVSLPPLTPMQMQSKGRKSVPNNNPPFLEAFNALRTK